MYNRIDAHIHTSFDSALLRESADISGVDYSPEGLKREMEENNIQYAISMGLKSNDFALLDGEAGTPMLDEEPDQGFSKGLIQRDMGDSPHDRIIPVGGINPYRVEPSTLPRLEEALSSRRIRGLKIYLGYFHKYAYDDVYKGFYELAARYNVPVILHTGDNYDRNAKVRFAHPLTVDDVAVDFRGTRFVIAHIGNPWVMDAGEVIYKNDNVYGDLSGLFPGNREKIDNIHDRDMEDIIKAYRWVDNPSKFLYGSDWPITPMGPYIRLMERIIEEATHPQEYERHLERVFCSNARELFDL